MTEEGEILTYDVAWPRRRDRDLTFRVCKEKLSSFVNVGLPAIGLSLQAGAADLQWVINAYLLPLSALLLFGGALGDRFGSRNTLIVGVHSSLLRLPPARLRQA